MKFDYFFLVCTFGSILLQCGCNYAVNSNQPVNNQNSAIVLPSPTPPLAVNSSPNQNPSTNGAPVEVLLESLELQKRCKHAPVNKVKATPISGVAPLKVTFDGSASSDPDGGKIVNWRWYFGNREFGEGRKVTYVYEKPGEYYIGLDVTDAQGQKKTDCTDSGTGIKITVTESQNTNENLIQKEN